MRWMKVTLISIVVLAIIGAGGYFGYNAAYASGETEGYALGYPAGQKAGYSTGYEEGYGSGEEDGYAEGYEKGEEDGYSEGHDEGYSLGEDEGYLKGYRAGETEGLIAGQATGYESGYSEGVDAALGHGYTLRDPTYSEALAFIRQDRTNDNEYIEGDYGVYVCSHYSRDTGNNAEEAGFRCAFVEIRYLESGHAIIAFDTIDQGLVYFDPQSDERVEPEIGKRYYQCIITRPGYYYEEPPFDDTIQDILVIW